LVRALAVSGSDLYVAGNFTIAGAVSAANIAKWNGHSWSALGSGLGGFGPDTFVSALALSGSDLYAGGWFTTAGDKASAFLARAFLPDIPELSIGRSGTGFTLSWPSAGTDGFKLEQSLSLGNPAGWIPNSDPVTDDGTIRSVIVPVTASRQFFRLRRP
jgi:hypothetical protein